MKKLLTVATIAILFIACESDDDFLRQPLNCECEITTQVHENSDPNSTILTSGITTVIDSCDNDGRVESSVEEGQYTSTTWNCF